MSVKQAQKLIEHHAQKGYEAAVHHLHHNNSVQAYQEIVTQ